MLSAVEAVVRPINLGLVETVLRVKKPRAHGGQGNTHARNALARLVKRLGQKTKLAFPMHIRYTELTLTRWKVLFGELGGQHG